jgi:hypothetical protein
VAVIRAGLVAHAGGELGGRPRVLPRGVLIALSAGVLGRVPIAHRAPPRPAGSSARHHRDWSSRPRS